MKRSLLCVARHVSHLFLLFVVLLWAGVLTVFGATNKKPILISQSTSTRAVAFESVTMRAEPFGLTLKGIRDSETRMRALGYNVWLHKYLAFVLSGVFAGFAGVFWAYYNGFVSPVDVQLVTSVEALLMVALGRVARLRY